MGHRIYHLCVVICWLGTMAWLVAAKLLPSLVGGDTPSYAPAQVAADRPADSWRIRLDESLIGYAGSHLMETDDGQRVFRSVVQCDVPLREITRELMGGMAFLADQLLPATEVPDLDLLVTTRMDFDASQQMTQVFTAINAGAAGELLRIRGTVNDNEQLRIEAWLGTGESAPMFPQTIHLPPGALVSDSLAPRAELRNLLVGQTWTLPVYRVFPPGRELQLLQATVEKHEVIFWDGRDVETKLVVYRDDPASKVGAAREVVGKEWIAYDGLILRQEVSFASLKLQFERMPASERNPCLEKLEVEKDPRLWPDDWREPQATE